MQISSYVTRIYDIECLQISRIFANKSAAADKSLIGIILKRQVILQDFRICILDYSNIKCTSSVRLSIWSLHAGVLFDAFIL